MSDESPISIEEVCEKYNAKLAEIERLTAEIRQREVALMRIKDICRSYAGEDGPYGLIDDIVDDAVSGRQNEK